MEGGEGTVQRVLRHRCHQSIFIAADRRPQNAINTKSDCIRSTAGEDDIIGIRGVSIALVKEGSDLVSNQPDARRFRVGSGAGDGRDVPSCTVDHIR